MKNMIKDDEVRAVGFIDGKEVQLELPKKYFRPRISSSVFVVSDGMVSMALFRIKYGKNRMLVPKSPELYIKGDEVEYARDFLRRLEGNGGIKIIRYVVGWRDFSYALVPETMKEYDKEVIEILGIQGRKIGDDFITRMSSYAWKYKAEIIMSEILKKDVEISNGAFIWAVIEEIKEGSDRFIIEMVENTSIIKIRMGVEVVGIGKI